MTFVLSAWTRASFLRFWINNEPAEFPGSHEPLRRWIRTACTRSTVRAKRLSIIRFTFSYFKWWIAALERRLSNAKEKRTRFTLVRLKVECRTFATVIRRFIERVFDFEGSISKDTDPEDSLLYPAEDCLILPTLQKPRGVCRFHGFDGFRRCRVSSPVPAVLTEKRLGVSDCGRTSKNPPATAIRRVFPRVLGQSIRPERFQTPGYTRNVLGRTRDSLHAESLSLSRRVYYYARDAIRSINAASPKNLTLDRRDRLGKE